MKTNFQCRSREEATNARSERHETHELRFSLSSSGGESQGEEALHMPNTPIHWQAQISAAFDLDYSVLRSAPAISNAPDL